jgi:hypothetical protein
MEPEWMKSIPSIAVCNFFYAWFVVYAIIVVISILFTIGVFSRKLGPAGVAIGINGIITSLLAGTFALFYYIICDRALMKEAFAAHSGRK